MSTSEARKIVFLGSYLKTAAAPSIIVRSFSCFDTLACRRVELVFSPCRLKSIDVESVEI